MRGASFLLAIGVAWSGCGGALVGTGGKAERVAERTLQVLSTNDLHGALSGEEAGGGRLGGFSRVAGLIDALRTAHGGPTLVVDAGDCFQGDFPVNAEEGAPCVRFFNAAGYAATTLGNHEFDYAGCGPDSADHPPREPRCALAAALADARYPIVSANVRQDPDGARLAVPGVVPFTVLDVGGIRVGITGVVTPTTPMVASFLGTLGLRFGDPVAAVRDVLPAMREAGATVVVVLAHLGGQCPGGGRLPGAQGSRCAVDGELGRFLDAFGPDEVALVVAGHAHAVLEAEGRGTPVVETPGKGMFLGRARIRVDGAGRPLPGGVAVDALAPVCGTDSTSAACRPGRPGFAGVAPVHPGVDAEVRALRERHEATCRQVVALAAEDVFHARQPETPMGNLTADLLLAAGRAGAGAGGADLAFTNMGSVRAALRAGEVTECDLHAVWPFNDPVVVVTMTGADVARLFAFLMVEVGKTPAVAGVRLERRGREVRVLDAATGQPLAPSRVFRVATTRYLVLGGDRVDEFIATLPADAVRILGYPTYRDAFREVLRCGPMIRAPGLGRIEVR